MKSWFLRWGPAIMMMAIIFFASGSPKSDIPEFGAWDLVAKKGGHFAGYALLAAALFRGVNGGREITRNHGLAAVCLAVLYAATDEWHQSFVPGRNPSFYDIAIDALGALAGTAVACRLRARSPRRQVATQESQKL